MSKLPKIKNGKGRYRGFTLVVCQYAERSGRYDVYDSCGIWQFDTDSVRKAVNVIDEHYKEISVSSEYLKLANACKSNMREMLKRVEQCEMIA